MKMPTQSESQRPQKYWRDDEELRWTVKEWATRMSVKEPPVRFQMMPEKWGTITPSGWLTLDPMLLTLPRDLGEMVIVHELVHLLAPNHSRLFKHFMDAYLPDWRERESKLQTYVKE
jgi:predicted metal-dependent hydrolase